jgi:EamA-like transporter family.
MKPNKREIMGSIIGIIGLILIMDPSISGENIGFLIAFLSTLSWALGSLLYKKHVSNYNTRISTSLQILLGGLPIAFIISLLYPPEFRASLEGFAIIIYMGFINQGLAYLIWYKLINRSPIHASLSLTCVPISATIMSNILLNEGLSFIRLIGIMIILFSLIISSNTFTYISELSKKITEILISFTGLIIIVRKISSFILEFKVVSKLRGRFRRKRIL